MSDLTPEKLDRELYARLDLEPFQVKHIADAIRAAEERVEKRLNAEMSAVADSTGCKITCREGGGPESIVGTLALSVARLKHDYDKAKEENARLRDNYQCALNFLEQEKAENARLREDAARLDWLQEQKKIWNGNWHCDLPDDEGWHGPARWENPRATWDVSVTVACGTYETPEALAKMDVRAAIDERRKL